MTKRTPPRSPEVRARAVRMVFDHREEHGSQWAAIQSIASKIDCSGETPRNLVRQGERDAGLRPGPTSTVSLRNPTSWFQTVVSASNLTA